MNGLVSSLLRRPWAGATGFLLLSSLFTPLHAYDLSVHEWRDRLLILVADDPDDATLNAQLRDVTRQRDGIVDRRLRVFRLFADSGWVDDRPLTREDVDRLRRDLRIVRGQRQLILIGLDGGIKRRAELSTDLTDVFAQIDGMPMRRQELRSRERAK